MRARTKSLCCRALALACVGVAAAGCASGPRTAPPEWRGAADRIYREVHGDAEKEAIDDLRFGLRERRVYGDSDPYYPLRRPDEVVPIWKAPRVDPRTGRRIGGHWEWTVLRRSKWVLP